MTDPDAALAAIKAAGDDFQSLYEAIKKAEFLEASPGDYRQAYRAAKSKLKKIHLAAKKKAEEDAKKGIVTKVSSSAKRRQGRVVFVAPFSPSLSLFLAHADAPPRALSSGTTPKRSTTTTTTTRRTTT